MVHDFIQELINKGEVFSYLTLTKFTVEIRFTYQDEVIQELYH